MLIFTYDDYKHVDYDTLHSPALRPASDYCIPDQILDALRQVIPIVQSHLISYNEDAKAKKVPELFSDSKFPGRKVSWEETLEITRFGLGRINPVFQAIFEAALNSRRISAQYVSEEFPMGHCYLTNRYHGGPQVRIDFKYDESVGDIINSFHEMGHMSAAELCRQGDLWDLEIYERHIDRLSAETQSQFIEFFAYDPEFLPQDSRNLSHDLNIALRFITMWRASSLISKFQKYDNAVQKDADPLDTAHEHLHSEMYIPGTFLASKLVDLAKDNKKKKAEILKVLYPKPGECDEHAGYPPFSKILALANIFNQQELNKLFVEKAVQLFSVGEEPKEPSPRRLLREQEARSNMRQPTDCTPSPNQK